MAVGDQKGLFVISGLERNWFPTNQLAQPFPLKVTVNVKGVSFLMEYSKEKNEEYRINPVLKLINNEAKDHLQLSQLYSKNRFG